MLQELRVVLNMLINPARSLSNHPPTVNLKIRHKDAEILLLLDLIGGWQQI